MKQNPRARKSLLFISTVTLAVPLIVLLGWVLEIRQLTSILPSYQTMKPLTASCFFLLGLFLVLRTFKQPKSPNYIISAFICGLCVCTISGLTLAEELFSINYGIDTLLFPELVRMENIATPGRPSAGTSLAFFILGFGVLCSLISRNITIWLSQISGLISIFIGLTAICGYLITASSLYRSFLFSTMALHTSILFVLAGIGVAFSNPRQGIAKFVLSEQLGGKFIRRFLPPTALLMLGLAYFGAWGWKAGLYDTNLGGALYLVGSLVILGSLIAFAVHDLNQSQANLEKSLADLVQSEQQNAMLLDLARRSEEQLHMTLLSADLGTWLMTHDYLSFSPIFRTMHRLSEKDEISIDKFTRLIHPDDRDLFLEACKNATESYKDINLEYRLYTGETTPTWISMRGKRNTGDEVLELVCGVAIDISARKAYEDQLKQLSNMEQEGRAIREANQTKNNFLAHMSHELRTPLNAIIGFTGTLLMKLPGPLTETQENQLSTIKTSANHLLSLINDILDVAKAESGKMNVKLETLHCNAIIKEVVSALIPSANSKGLKLTSNLPTESLVAHADRRILTQILFNLIGNSIKFTNSGKIEVEALAISSDEKMWVEIKVTDSGVGIDQKDLHRLFQPFSQVEQPQKKNQAGTGLGLYLTQMMVEALGGQIKVSSHLGQGSCFAFTLPRVQPPE